MHKPKYYTSKHCILCLRGIENQTPQFAPKSISNFRFGTTVPIFPSDFLKSIKKGLWWLWILILHSWYYMIWRKKQPDRSLFPPGRYTHLALARESEAAPPTTWPPADTCSEAFGWGGIPSKVSIDTPEGWSSRLWIPNVLCHVGFISAPYIETLYSTECLWCAFLWFYLCERRNGFSKFTFCTGRFFASNLYYSRENNVIFGGIEPFAN